MSYVNIGVGQTELEYQGCVAQQQDHAAWLGEQSAYDQSIKSYQDCVAVWDAYNREILANNLAYEAAVAKYAKDKAAWDEKNKLYQQYQNGLLAVTQQQSLQRSQVETKYGIAKGKIPVNCVSKTAHDKYYGKCHTLKGIGWLGDAAQSAMYAAVSSSKDAWMDTVPACAVAELPLCATLTAYPHPGKAPTAPTRKKATKPSKACGSAPALRSEPANPSNCPLPPSGGGAPPGPATPTPPSSGPIVQPTSDPATWIDENGVPVTMPEEVPETTQAGFFGGRIGTAGLIAILVVGGVGYYAWTKRKKKAA